MGAIETVEIRPQPGKQEIFLSSSADIAIYGGSAGGGKSFGLLLEPLRHVTTNPDFYSVFFRRSTTQIRNPGGLWDESMKLYPFAQGTPIQTILEWKWNGGGRVKFAHLEHEKTVLDWQGSQIALVCCEVGTLVLMGNGTYKKIELLNVGDKVQTLQGIRPVKAVGKPEKKECVQITLPNGDYQIQSSSHSILTSLGWTSYDIACESLPFHDMGIPKKPHFFDKFFQLFDKKPQSLLRYPKEIWRNLWRKKGSIQSLSDRQFLSVISSCKDALSPGRDCELSRYGIARLLSHVLILLLTMLFLLSPLLQARVFAIAFLRRVSPYAESVCKHVNLILNYLSCTHRDDEPSLSHSSNARYDALQLDGVVVRIQNDSLYDDRGIIHKHNRYKLRYAHPYTGEERISEDRYYLSSACVAPVGARDVVHIMVEGENHYITKSGLVNKNCFDELCHFTQGQFFYMLSRNRSTCGVKPYVRATCNPDADSWVAGFISWWIDQNGFAIEERAGVLRWFIRVKGEIMWADSREECIELYGIKGLDADDPKQSQPKSVTFIPAKLQDNPKLMDADPGYMSNLLALDVVSQARLLDGNWKIKWDTGMEIFREISLLDENGAAIDPQMHPDYVYATIDTAMKDGSKNDGTSVVYWARYKHFGIPLVLLDWDLKQMEGSLLEFWLPDVFRRLEELSVMLKARGGSIGAWIEDKSSGTILLQQSKRREWPAHEIDSKLTALGKSERAISVSGYVHRGNVKISKFAYDKVVTYKSVSKNHLLSQVVGFRIGVDNKTDDCTDGFSYGVAIGLGDSDGW